LSGAKVQLYCYILRISNDAGPLGSPYLADRQPHFTFLLAPTLQVETLVNVQLRDKVSEIEHNCWIMLSCLYTTITTKQRHLFPKQKMQLWPCC